MEKLEEQIAHLSRTVDDLSDIVARQEAEIVTLNRRVHMLMQREGEREASTGGAAVMDQDLWDQTIDISINEGVLSAEPDDGAFTTEYAEAAQKLLADRGVDAIGNGFTKVEVTLNEGGN